MRDGDETNGAGEGTMPDASATTARAYRPGDEAAIVTLLNDAFPGGWGTVERWRAKHLRRPGFDAADVVLAERQGVLVGCLHSSVVRVRLGREVSVPAAIDGDLAVAPAERGRGISELLYAVSGDRLAARGVVLRFGYTSAPNVDYYRRVLGYVSGFDTARAYRKHLDVGPIRDRLLALLGSSPDVADPGAGPVIGIEVTGLEPIRLRLGPHAAAATHDARVDLLIRADQRLFDVAGEGRLDARAAWRLWRAGDLRIRGPLLGIVRVGMWAVRRAPRLLRGRRSE